MKQRFTLAFVALLCVTHGLFAQSVVILSIPDVIAPGGTSEVCVPIVADTFPNIVTVQFSLEWDTTQIEFTELRLGDNPFGFEGMYSSMPVSNNIAISHIPSDSRGVTLSPGTVLFEACFNTTQTEGASTVTFDGFLPPEFAQDDGTFMAVPNTLHPGSISYGENVAVSVLPGDTNDDRQVDHRDIINIGYIFSANGPARADTSTAFAPRVASVWAGSFNNGLNYATADASGNGVIDLADLAVVLANYDQALNAGFTAAPDVSTPTGPALRLETEAIINAGVETTLTVLLGDGNDPDALGYALAFALEYDPAQIEENSIRVAYDGAYLGDELLSIDMLSTHTEGRLEIALSRKDQLNTANPGGKVCSISFVAIDPDDLTGIMEVPLRLVPNAFHLADQSSGAINGATDTLRVQTALGVREPAWGANLNIYPNPYTAGHLTLRGDLPPFNAVYVSDLNGRPLKTWTGNARWLDLTSLPAGTYLLRVEIDGERVSRRVVKR